jgi:hypothetical protein
MPTGATRSTLAVATTAVGLVIAGCGDDDGGSEPAGPDPATIVPAQAIVYAEATVRPDDDQREDLESNLGTVLGGADVEGTVREQVDLLLSDTGLTYEEDIAPWLGARAGLFLLSFEDEGDGAFVVPMTNREAAQASLNKLAESEGVRGERTEDGASYVVTKEDSALGIVGEFAVLGTRVGFDEAAEASRSGSLAESQEFTELTDDVRGDELMTAYVDPAGVLGALANAGEVSTRESEEIGDSPAGMIGGPVVVSAGADDTGFFAEITGQGDLPIGGGSDLIDRLPDDAWAAFALADAGAVAGPAVLGALASNEVLGAVFDRIQAEGVNVGEFDGSIGDVGGWFGGTNVLGARGGLIFEATDEGAAEGLLDGLRTAFSGDPRVRVTPGDSEGEAFSVGPADVPIEFPFVLRDGLLVTGLAEQSIEQVYAPETSLEDSDAYEAATQALGDDFPVTALLDFQTLVGFFEGLNVADEPDLQAALPYLARLDVFAAGASEDDGATTLRFILTPQEEE